MNKNIFAVILLLFLSMDLLVAQHTADDALFLHKKHLLQNFNVLKNTIQSGLQRQVDALYYRLELEIRFEPKSVTGKVTARFQSKADNLDLVELDLDEQMQVTAVSGGDVSGFSHAGQVLAVNLAAGLNNGDIFEIVIEYSGLPDPGNPKRWFVFDELEDGSNSAWTLSEPYGARFWWPCKDTPLDKADSVDVIVTVPDEQTVVSNGILVSNELTGDKRTFHWRERYPIATYLVSLAIAPYVHFSETHPVLQNEEMLLDYYVYPEDEELAREILPNAKDHLDVLEQVFGPYPFSDEKYGLAQFGWTSGAMEHQTISSIGRVTRGWEYVYVHELGHQWFGDALTCASWQDIWLNEGFASYSEALYAERAGYADLPPGEDSYKAFMQRQIYTGDGTLKVQDTLNLGSVFGSIVYNKGSWVLHMLRRVLGEEDFFTALYTYANGDLQYTSVRTDDFKQVCEKVSGRDLQRFFDQWIHYPYFPRYEFFWNKDETGFGTSAKISLNILQRQNTVVYEMPVDLKFIFADGSDTLVTVDNFLRDQDYTFDFDSYPVEVVFDPDNWILKDVQDLSGGSFLPEIVIESVYPNPANSVVNVDVVFWGQSDLVLKIFDVNGREVNQLRPYLSSKTHRSYFKWENDDRSGRPVAAGIYFLQPVSKEYPLRDVKKVVIIK